MFDDGRKIQPRWITPGQFSPGKFLPGEFSVIYWVSIDLGEVTVEGGISLEPYYQL